MNKLGMIVLVVGLTVLFLGPLDIASGQEREFDHVISNSENWKDVFSVLHYGNLGGFGQDFLVSPRHGALLLPGLNREARIRVVSSRDQAFVINYPSILRDEGFTVFDELTVRDANVELIDELPEIRDFVIISDTYGYDAVAVAPYALLNNAWVFFADRSNIADIEAVLDDRDVNSLLIYGFVDREVRDSLARFDPEIINNADRFLDNIDIVERYLEIKPTTQIAFTNGDFLEKGLMNGFDPVLFTGRENVPEQIQEYLQRSDFGVGVLVGSDLVGAATNIRRSTGISVIVKFAQGARNPDGPIAAVEGLDLFYLPVPVLDLDLHSARYNRASSQLEITYRSNSNIPLYFRGTITPQDENGDGSRVGDVEAVFIAPEDFKTVSYPDITLTGNSLSAEIFTLYGEAPSSLEKILEGTFDIEIVDAIDSCEIAIDKVTYSKPKDGFAIKVENLAPVDCWVDIELTDLIVDSRPITIGSVGSTEIPAGRKRTIEIEQELTDEDLLDNSLVNLIAYYGEREDSLVKILQGRFEFNIQTISFVTIMIIIILIILLILLFLVWRRRKKEKDDW